MDNFAVVAALRKITDIRERVDPPRMLLDRVICDAHIKIDPSRVTPYPSSSGNIVEYLGTEQETSVGDVKEIIELYREHLIDRFFVVMSPGKHGSEAHDHLVTCGLQRFQGTTYPTLVREIPGKRVSQAHSDLMILKLCAGDTELVESATILEPWLRVAVTMPEFDLWIACERHNDTDEGAMGDNVVARAIAISSDAVTYLAGMTTLPEYRGRGAQSMLIRRRMEDGLARGSTVAVSETLGLLKTSLNNLKRAGFRVAYTKTVFEWRSNW